MKWFHLAAEQGHANAQFLLGFMYATGRGVAQDYIQGHKWINLAASRTTGGSAGLSVRERRTGKEDDGFTSLRSLARTELSPIEFVLQYPFRNV